MGWVVCDVKSNAVHMSYYFLNYDPKHISCMLSIITVFPAAERIEFVSMFFGVLSVCLYTFVAYAWRKNFVNLMDSLTSW